MKVFDDFRQQIAGGDEVDDGTLAQVMALTGLTLDKARSEGVDRFLVLPKWCEMYLGTTVRWTSGDTSDRRYGLLALQWLSQAFTGDICMDCILCLNAVLPHHRT